MQNIIEVKNISKSFGKVRAVDDISFYVEEGSLFSFLGTNGAGKSTVISIILTLLQADNGTVVVDGYTAGKENDSIRKKIGVVFQESLLDPLLSVQENLEIRAQSYGLDKHERQAAIQRSAEFVDIRPILKRRYGKLSGGQKRRVDIARALLHQPSILLLDEPTTGLDPQSREQVWKMIGHLQKELGMTVFLTTHYIEEAANSDFVIVIKEGKILAKGTPSDLKNRYSANRLFITAIDSNELRARLHAEKISFEAKNGVMAIDLPSTMEAIDILNKFQSLISSFEVKKSSLDDVFISIHDRKDA